MKKVIIIGAGPAGIGTALVLQKMKIPFVIIEREDVGDSFMRWPKETRFISPSFTGNFFGMPDLNAITPDTSPAYSLQTEHPTGAEYAAYLQLLAKNFKLPIKRNCEVSSVKKVNDLFLLETTRGEMIASYVIWAAGEFVAPNDEPFTGAEHCVHSSKVTSWGELEGDSFVVIGGYESGLDAAYQLASYGKKVVVLDSNDELSIKRSDSSYSISPFTRDRLTEYQDSIRVLKNSKVFAVEKDGDKYNIRVQGGQGASVETKPIMATGFDPGLGPVDQLFAKDGDHILLSDDDESTETPGLFLVGPKVQHKNDVFCFIYKYRQRFPVVAEVIAERLGITAGIEEVLEDYKKNQFYLRDLSCCGNECPC